MGGGCEPTHPIAEFLQQRKRGKTTDFSFCSSYDGFLESVLFGSVPSPRPRPSSRAFAQPCPRCDPTADLSSCQIKMSQKKNRRL